MDTLKDYLVVYNHLNIQEPDTELVKELLNLMCLDPAEGLKLHCGREYEFSLNEARNMQFMLYLNLN